MGPTQHDKEDENVGLGDLDNSAGDGTTDNDKPMLFSRSLADWLAACDVSLALATNQAGRLVLIGRNGSDRR